MSTGDYFDRVNPDLLALIPPDAKVVLEIGCGAGALAEAYRRINPGLNYFGIEINEEAAKTARQRMGGVNIAVRDIEDELTSPTFYEETVDCLILGDVLEHLRNPWDVLKSVVRWIKPDAQVLASIPNIQHFATLYNLMHGNWDYADEGTLDRTHLRFFTLKSIREMFEQAGLQVYEIRGVRAANDEPGWKLWKEFAEKLNIDLKQTLPLQYIVRAIKPAEIEPFEVAMIEPIERTVARIHESRLNRIHIHAITAELCCARPRILEPFAALSTIPGVRCTTGRNLDTVNPDIHIQQRARIVDLVIQRAIIDSGAILIAELDDDPESPLYTHGKPFDPMPLQAVHAIQVSTERLAKIVRQWNPNVAVFENQIAEFLDHGEEITSGRLHSRIFYGAQNRENDWEPIVPNLLRVLRDHPGVSFEVIHDRKFYDALPDSDAHPKTFTPFCEYREYRKRLHGCDIALLPLEPTRFNECKSDIKFLECAAEGVCVLASPTVYGRARDETRCMGLPLLFYLNRTEFDDHLRRLIARPDERSARAQAAYAYVRDHRLLGQHFRKRLQWYQGLLRSKEALDRSLRERVPELFHSSAYHTLQPSL